MPNYDNDRQQRDLVLSPNEFVFVQSSTNGVIKTYVGPTTITISGQDTLVRFNERTKTFIPEYDPDEAKQLMILPPENWYAILKNPTINSTYPEIGKASISPELDFGKKVNIRGPVNFALFPGQMAKVIRGHSLRSNQYLLARVYEAESANTSQGEIRDADGNIVETKETYVNGQILVIKGTEVSFYIPPTGIEVMPIDGDDRNGYIREAVTLERLEYCILKDEDGNKRYVHGPEVVFPRPTEQFVKNQKNSLIFRAIELSKISGIYVKVIAEYTDDNKVVHPVGEELFITGDDQMIYYPRPEHSIISYDNKFMHHAIAIPEGEGRYILNRLTGEIKTVKGPAMYLPDPRTEVVVKRKLSDRECRLFYPGNEEALAYNRGLTEKSVEKSLSQSKTLNDAISTAYLTCNNAALTFESNASIARGTSYTKPRTITLDNKFDGVVSVDIWTGYAVNLISKSGARQVICGPQTIMLDYDQTLGELQFSTGTPKNSKKPEHSVFLNYENNRVSDIIDIETKDFVKAAVKVSYCVSFDTEYSSKWFDVEDYVKYLCDRERSLIKRMAKNYTIEELANNYVDLIRNIAINAPAPNGEKGEESRKPGRFFPENGMRVTDCDVLGITVEDAIAYMLNEHQHDMVQKALELSDAEKRVAVAEKLAEAEEKENAVAMQKVINKMEREREKSIRSADIAAELARKKEAEALASKQAEKDVQILINAIQDEKLARDKKEADAAIARKKAEADIETAKQEAYAATIERIMQSITPGLVEAMQGTTNAELFRGITNGIAPYALAKGESAADFVSTLLRGTTLEKVVDKIGTENK